jgi:hypothetical protein
MSDTFGEAVRLAGTRAWALVLGLVLATGTAVGWALLAPVETTVSLDGVLVAGRGPAVVTAPVQGVVVQVGADVGTPVNPATPLVVLATATGRVTVTSPVSGAVSALPAYPGQHVAAGETLAGVDQVGGRLGATLLGDPVAAAGLRPGMTVRGTVLRGHTAKVVSVALYPVTVTELAHRLGAAALPGDGNRLVRPVSVEVDGVTAWPGATLTPVRLDVVVGKGHPADALLGRAKS